MTDPNQKAFEAWATASHFYIPNDLPYLAWQAGRKALEAEQAQAVEPVGVVTFLPGGVRPILSRLPGARLNSGDKLYTRPAPPQAQQVAVPEVFAAWLQWCLDNCDDSPEYNFGTTATEHMRALLAGYPAPMPPTQGAKP